MLEEFLKNVVTEGRKKNLTLDEMIKRLKELYEEAEEIDKINKKSISEIAKTIEKLFFKIYNKQQIDLYLEVVDDLQKCMDEKSKLVAICESKDRKYNYNIGYTYGRINTMTQYILMNILKFGRIQQRDFKKTLKPIYDGSTPFIKCFLYYEFDISKIKEVMQ